MAKYYEQSTGKLNKKKQDLLNSLPESKKLVIQGGMNNQLGIVTGPAVIKNEKERYFFGNLAENNYMCMGADNELGAKGYEDTAAIRVVAGHSGHKRLSDGFKEADDKTLYRSPDILADSTTFEVVQSTNIDKRLGLVQGKVGDSEKLSTIVGKADSIRLVAEKGIKIVTAISDVDSKNKPHFVIKGIDLIAGNSDKGLQPIAKGQNTIDAIEELSNIVDTFIEYTMQVLVYQAEANLANADHFHLGNSGFSTENIDPDLTVKNNSAAMQFSDVIYSQLDSLKGKIRGLKDKYINNPTSPTYINSGYNNTN
jgi:hypothetical protein